MLALGASFTERRTLQGGSAAGFASGRSRVRTPVLCKAGKRRPLIKQRSVPAAQRRKLKNRDEARALDLDPDSPKYAGQLTSLVTGANGPLQLAKVVQEHGPRLSGTQVSLALARLAAFATFMQLSAEQQAAHARTARKCALLMRQKVADCDLNSYARATYALARLGLHDAQLLDALVRETEERLGLLTPDALAAMLSGLAVFGHRPSDEWLGRYCLEVYARFSKFNANELAAIVYGLARLQHRPSEAWLERASELFRAAMRIACTPPSLVKFLFGFVGLQGRPSFNWLSTFLSEALPRIDLMTSRELATLLWCVAQLGHRPDQPYLDAWLRCATKLMPAAQPQHLVLALQALAALGVTPLPARYARAALARLRDPAVLSALGGAELVSVLLSLAALRVRPGGEWLEDVLAACEGQLPAMSPGMVVELAWCLGRLQYQPGPDFTAAFESRLSAELDGLSVPQLAVLAWAYSVLRLAPPADGALLQRLQDATAGGAAGRAEMGAALRELAAEAGADGIGMGVQGAPPPPSDGPQAGGLGVGRGRAGGGSGATASSRRAALQAKLVSLMEGQ